jgi:Plasmid replication protein/RNA helicase
MKKAKTTPTSMITAVIRVTCVNETKSGVVLYNQADIEDILVKWSTSNGMVYWYIKHDGDKEFDANKKIDKDNEPGDHFHIVIQFKKAMPFKSVKDRFPHGQIETARKMKSAVQYLIHANDPEKKQYDWEAIITNSEDLNLYKPDKNEMTLESVIAKIDKGEILEHNKTDYIPTAFYIKHKAQINNAFEYVMERFCMDKNRDIIVKFMSGGAGLGKTTFAKWYCEKRNLSYYVSSSSNDPFQGYKGEQVLILDDLRDSAFEFEDILKILDNHTRTSSKSRYINKTFVGKTIIITSTVPLKDWYKDQSAESKRQLYRRVAHMYEFEDDWIYSKQYDEEKSVYIPTAKVSNFVKKEMDKNRSLSTEMFEGFGVEVEKINSNEITTIRDGLEQTKLF